MKFARVELLLGYDDDREERVLHELRDILYDGGQGTANLVQIKALLDESKESKVCVAKVTQIESYKNGSR